MLWHNNFCGLKEYDDAKVTISENDISDCAFDNLGAPIITGGSNEWGSERTISVVSMPQSELVLDHYQYYISDRNNILTGGSWIDLEPNVSEITLQVEGEHYVFMRGIDTNAKNGEISAYETIRIDRTDYSIAVPGTINGGSITADKIQAKVGDLVNLTISPTSGYELDTLFKNETNIKGTTSFRMPKENVTINGTFKRTILNITIVDSQNGEVSSDLQSAFPGETVTLTIVPNSNYGLSSLTIDDDNLATNTFVMPSKDIIIEATFSTLITNFSVGSTNFNAPYPGYYKIELWGARGGSDNSKGGYGGDIKGYIYLQQNELLTFVVGGAGEDRPTSWACGYSNPSCQKYGGSNGGGHAWSSGGGGGATDVRNNTATRIMVAGGGGGASDVAYGLNGGASGSGGSGSSSGTGFVCQNYGYHSYLCDDGYLCCGDYDGGGGGGGYQGGLRGRDNNRHATGGSNYYNSTSIELISQQTELNYDNGKARITYIGIMK